MELWLDGSEIHAITEAYMVARKLQVTQVEFARTFPHTRPPPRNLQTLTSLSMYRSGCNHRDMIHIENIRTMNQVWSWHTLGFAFTLQFPRTDKHHIRILDKWNRSGRSRLSSWCTESQSGRSNRHVHDCNTHTISSPQTLTYLWIDTIQIDDVAAQRLAEALKINQVSPSLVRWSVAIRRLLPTGTQHTVPSRKPNR